MPWRPVLLTLSLTLVAVLAGPTPTAGAGAAPGAPPPAGAPAAYAPWGWPLSGAPAATRGFDPPPQRWAAGHRGVDLAAVPGSAVLAAGAGVVVFAGRVAGRPVVSVAHDGGLRTTYEPVTPSVRAGQGVARGSRLGTLLAGHVSCPAAACLHWGLRRGDTYLDPLALLRPPRLRLLPWRDPEDVPDA